jgi:6-pyruvoyltetrahydropterin/6-carboxytetrahydropterin synthase
MIRSTCTRKLGIDAGHRVTQHESKCRNVHGHRYQFEITAHASELDEVGRVIDFGKIKLLVGTWLDQHLDHGYIHHPHDEIGHSLREQGHKTYQMPEALGEPTAENLAHLVLVVAQRLLGPEGITVPRVRCHETPNCYADATLQEIGGISLSPEPDLPNW